MIPVIAFLCLLVGVISAQDYDEVRSQNKWWSDYANLYDYDDAEIDKRMNLIITKNILPGDAPLPLDERLFFRAPGSSEEIEFVPVAAPSPPPRRKTSRPPTNRRQPTSAAPPLPSSSPRSEPTRARIFPSTRRPLFRPFATSPPPPTTEAEEEEPDSREEPESDFNSQPEIRPLPVPDSRPAEIPQASVLSDSQNVFVTRGIEAPKANQSPNRLPFIPPPAGAQRPIRPSSRPPSEIPVTSPLPPPAPPLANVPSRPSRPDKEIPLPSSAIPPKFFVSTQNPIPSNLPPNFTPVLAGRPPLTDFHSSPVTSDFTRGPNAGSSLPPLSQAPLQNFQPLVSPNPIVVPNPANSPPPLGNANANGNGNGRRTQVLKRRLRPSSTASPLDDSEEVEIANERVGSPAIQLTQDVSRVRSQGLRLQAPPTASEAPVGSKFSKKPLGSGASVSPAKSSPSSLNSPTGFAPSRTFTPPPLLNPHLAPGRANNRSLGTQTNNFPRNQGSSPPQPQQFLRGTTLRQPLPPNGEFQNIPPQHPFQGGIGRFQQSVSTLPPPPIQSGPPPPHRPAAVRRRPVIVSSTNAPFEDIQPRSPEHEIRGRVRVAATTAIPTHAFVSSPSPRSSTLRDLSDIHISSNTEIIPPSALRETVSSQRVARVPANRAAGERSSTRFQRDETRRRHAMLVSASSSPVGMAAKPDGTFEFVPDVEDLNLLSQLSALSDNSLPSTTTSPNPFHSGHFLPEAIKFIFGTVENDRWKNNTMVESQTSAKSWTPPCVQNGRNFCLLTDFYPNALIDRVVKEHVVEVSKLFNELRSFEKPSLSTPHSEDEKGQFVCESQAGVIRPGWVRDVTTGNWLVVINTDEFSQLVRIETCSRPNEACLFIAPYYRSSCREHHSVQRLVAIDPQAAAPTPRVALVQMPCGCSCMVGTGQPRQTPIR